MASSSSNGGRPTLRPLSRRATRYFVIGLLVATLVIALIGTRYLVRAVREAQQQRAQDEASWQARLDAFIASEFSGELKMSEAGLGGVGLVAPSALETSTVDLGEEFTNMIITQRAFSAAGKTITVADEMLDELIRLKR
jgi:hypothetical protein